MFPLLADLRAAGHTLTLCSSTRRSLFPSVWARFRLSNYFQHFLLSYEHRLAKPALFTKLPAGACVIDDTLTYEPFVLAAGGTFLLAHEPGAADSLRAALAATT